MKQQTFIKSLLQTCKKKSGAYGPANTDRKSDKKKININYQRLFNKATPFESVNQTDPMY